MLLNRAQEFEDIVHVNIDQYTDAIAEYCRHQMLECRWCIAVTHLHYLAPVGVQYCGKCCF
jgi:hypothetical protein